MLLFDADAPSSRKEKVKGKKKKRKLFLSFIQVLNNIRTLTALLEWKKKKKKRREDGNS